MLELFNLYSQFLITPTHGDENLVIDKNETVYFCNVNSKILIYMPVVFSTFM